MRLSAMNCRKPVQKKMQELSKQMKKDVSILMDAAQASSALKQPLEGLVTFEGAYMNAQTQEACIVLEYMDGGSLEDVLKQVRTRVTSLQSTVCLTSALRLVQRSSVVAAWRASTSLAGNVVAWMCHRSCHVPC